jgi:hypothetical protein
MGQRQKMWATRTRNQMLLAMGSKCAACGTRDNLEMDCIQPQGDAHHKFERSHRMSFYRNQARKGNLQILCADCNAIKGDCSRDEWLLVRLTAEDRLAVQSHRISSRQGTSLTPTDRQAAIRWARLQLNNAKA